MSTTPYPYGQTVRLPASNIRDGDGVPADPIALDLTVWRPDGTTITVPIGGLTRAAVGSWYYDYLPPTDGRYGYRYQATGPTTSVDGQFTVSPSPFLIADGPIPGWPGAYLTVPEFLASPSGSAVNTLDLIAGGSAAQQQAELANVLLRASQQADALCEIPLGARQVVEHQEIYIRAAGTVQYAPRKVSGSIPLVAVTGFGYGAGPGSLTTLAPASTWVQDNTAVIPLSGGGMSWSGSLQFGAPGRGSRVYAQVTYVAGFPCTTLAGPVAVGAVALHVADATGIMPGEQLRIHDPGREEQVTVGPNWMPTTGPGSVPLAAATLSAHRAGTGVADMPMDVKTAVGQIAASLIRRPTDTGSADAFGPGEKPALDNAVGSDQARSYAAAVATLGRYRRGAAD